MIKNQRYSNRRNKFRSGDRNFRNNGSGSFKSNSNNGYQKTYPARNNHNAPKLIEKYNSLAREAQSNGDKVLSENYLQYADHFLRISMEQKKIINNPKILPVSKVEKNNDLMEETKTEHLTEQKEKIENNNFSTPKEV